jgi:hypothetical protein
MNRDSVQTDSLGSLNNTNDKREADLVHRIENFNTQFQKHELQFELKRVPVGPSFDNIITNTSCADVDLDAKYLESSLVSNGFRNTKELRELAAGRDRGGSAEEKERGAAERNHSSIEMRANQGLAKKLFLADEGQYDDNVTSFKNLAETPLFMSNVNVNTHSSASIEMPKEIHSQEKRPEKSSHKDLNNNLMMIQESPATSPVHKHLDKSLLSGDFQSCNIMPDSAVGTHEKHNERMNLSNFNDNYKRENA